MKKLLLFLSFLGIISCNKDAETERQIRKIIQQEILTNFNQNTKSIELQKEADDQYLAVVALENGEMMQLIFQGSPEKYSLSETENSRAAATITSNLGVQCTSLTLKAIDDKSFNGTATLATGEKFAIFYDRELGFYATDQEGLGIVTRHQIARTIAMPCRSVSLQKTDQEMVYQGEAQIETGEKILIFVHQQQGWYPVNELNNLLLLTKHQIQAQNGSKVDTIFAQRMDTGFYIGRVRLSQPQAKEYTLNMKHKGTFFDWALGDI